MMPYSWLNPDKRYGFHDYFRLNPPIEELVEYFGYTQQTVEHYPFVQAKVDSAPFATLKQDLLRNIQHTNLTSETARREALIAPILFKVAAYLNLKIAYEYPIRVNRQLGGRVDYLLRHTNPLLVIEAKQADLQRGFIQMTTELIAVDQWLDTKSQFLYGCVSIGDIWRFVILDRPQKIVVEDLNAYLVPGHLMSLVQVLVGLLSSK